jgi:hypothetical protein
MPSVFQGNTQQLFTKNPTYFLFTEEEKRKTILFNEEQTKILDLCERYFE